MLDVSLSNRDVHIASVYDLPDYVFSEPIEATCDVEEENKAPAVQCSMCTDSEKKHIAKADRYCAICEKTLCGEHLVVSRL